MRNSVFFNNKKPETVNPDEILKVTALFYLKNALQKDEYEGCADLIQTAKKFGARQSEISAVLTGYQRGGEVQRQNEANRGNRGRRRF